jgi:hypothetical protein
MNTSALITMLSAEAIIAFFTIYFLWKAVSTPPRAEPDSYSFNDDEVR